MTTESAARGAFEDLLSELVRLCQIRFGQDFQGALLFGSTVSQLKPVTDIDLIVAITGLPKNRRERLSLFSDIEVALKPKLDHMQARFGIRLELSEKLRTPDELSHFSPLYLDWVDHSRILFERNAVFSDLIKKTAQYISESGARRVQRGLKWYWILREGVTGDDEFEVGWKTPGAS